VISSAFHRHGRTAHRPVHDIAPTCQQTEGLRNTSSSAASGGGRERPEQSVVGLVAAASRRSRPAAAGACLRRFDGRRTDARAPGSRPASSRHPALPPAVARLILQRRLQRRRSAARFALPAYHARGELQKPDRASCARCHRHANRKQRHPPPAPAAASSHHRLPVAQHTVQSPASVPDVC